MSKEIKAGIIICGGGGAGLASALAAAEKRAGRIVLLEKLDKAGGNTAFAFNFFAINSPAQKRAGIDINGDEFFKVSMNWSHWKTNPKILRAFINKSGDTIQWLEKKGLHFDCAPLYINQDLVVSHRIKGNGGEIIRILLTECEKWGVEIRFNTRAKKLLTDSKGKVSGIVAVTGSEEYVITSRSVILATGGYGGSKKLMKKYYPGYRENMRCGGIPHSGGGLSMAMEIGAATEGFGAVLGGGGLPGPVPQIALRVGVLPDIFEMPLVVLSSEPQTIWVNNRGERFADETLGSSHPMASEATKRQPDSDTYTIFDQKIVEDLTENGLVHGYLNGNRKGVKLVGLARGLEDLASQGWVKISGIWREIADWIGADVKSLEATIESYNTACARGYDPIYVKNKEYLKPLSKPPFYAIRGRQAGDHRDFFLDTRGGIKVNEQMEVLDLQNNAVRGLYAAGTATGSWDPIWNDSMLSGNGASFAINSGRVAGENAVEFSLRFQL